MRTSYLTAGITLGRLAGLLRKNRVALDPVTLLRLAFLVQSAAWSSLFAFIEKVRFGKSLKNLPVPDDPIFIIGHWRTGSTFLHQLMSLDPHLHAPTLFQVAVPDSFLVSYPFYRPVFKRMVNEHRPMDMVRIGMNEPQEDEYAIFRMTGCSPLKQLVFARDREYFLKGNPCVVPDKKITAWWTDMLALFYKKLALKSGKRIISKNPFHSYRISLLLKMFPGAKFIHIIRNPLDVVPSTIHMWEILGKQNSLTGIHSKPITSDVADQMALMLDLIEQRKKELPEGTIAEIRYEDLESRPEETMMELYRKLRLPIHPGFLPAVRSFLRDNRNYSKNRFTLDEKDKVLIIDRMKEFMERNHYH